MKGFELRMYDMNKNVLYRELFDCQQTKRHSVERKAKQIMEDPGCISPKKHVQPASFKIFER